MLEDKQELDDLQSSLASFLAALDYFFKLDEISDIIFAYLSTVELSFSDIWMSLSAEESEHLIVLILHFRFLPAWVRSIKASLSSFNGSSLSLFLCSSSTCITISSSYSGLMVLGGRTPEPLGELPEALPLEDPRTESSTSELATGSLVSLSMILGALNLDDLMFG